MPRQTKPDLIIGKDVWKYLGSGNFNDAYVATLDGQKCVLKIPKAASDKKAYSETLAAMDIPDRAVRLWNLFNPDFPARKYDRGWVAPFIEAQRDPRTQKEITPTPTEINHAIINLYQRTGRIVVDALTPGNFKKMTDGKIICVDIGAALQLETSIQEEKSQASFDFWKEMKDRYQDFFVAHIDHAQFGPIATTTKALLFLQHVRPDVQDVSKLKGAHALIIQLSRAYDTSRTPADIYKTFPVNLDYFAKLPLLQDIISDGRFTKENKEDLCILNQQDRFSQTHKQLLLLLINKFEFNGANAIEVIKKKDIAAAGHLLIQLSNSQSISKTIENYISGNVPENEMIPILKKAAILSDAKVPLLTHLLTTTNKSSDKEKDQIRLAWKAAGARQSAKTYVKGSPEESAYRAIQAARNSTPPDAARICDILIDFVNNNPKSMFTQELKKFFGTLFETFQSAQEQQPIPAAAVTQNEVQPEVIAATPTQSAPAAAANAVAEADVAATPMLKKVKTAQEQQLIFAAAAQAQQPIPAAAAMQNATQSTITAAVPKQSASANAVNAANQSSGVCELDKQTYVASLNFKYLPAKTEQYLTATYNDGKHDTVVRIYSGGNLTNKDGALDLPAAHPLRQNLGKLLSHFNNALDDTGKRVLECAIANQVIKQYEKASSFFFIDTASKESKDVIHELKVFIAHPNYAKNLANIIGSAKPEGRLHNILVEIGLGEFSNHVVKKSAADSSAPTRS